MVPNPIPANDALADELVSIGRACLGRAARRTANVVTRAYNRALSPLGIEVTQFTILCTVALDKAESASELAELVGVERSTLARNLDRLVASGLVLTEKGGGRRVRHRLSGQGIALIQQAIPLWRQAQDAIIERLPRDADTALRADFRHLRHAAHAVLAG